MLKLKNFPPMQVQFEFQISNWLLVYPMQAQIITHSTWFMRFTKDINVFRKKRKRSHSNESQTIKFSQLLKKSIASSNSSVPISTTSPSLFKTFWLINYSAGNLPKLSDWLSVGTGSAATISAAKIILPRENPEWWKVCSLSLNRCCCFDCWFWFLNSVLLLLPKKKVLKTICKPE